MKYIISGSTDMSIKTKVDNVIKERAVLIWGTQTSQLQMAVGCSGRLL